MNEKFSSNWNKCVIQPEAPLREALSAINASGLLMACIVSPRQELLAILMDADIRRALLNGATLENRSMNWANPSPVTGPSAASEGELRDLARRYGVRELPLIDEEGRLADVFLLQHREKRAEFSEEVLAPSVTIPNAMFIPAGGRGSRLRAAVSDRPKALALVGGRPILETLMRRAVYSGIQKFFVSVNYMAEAVEEHLKHPRYSDLFVETLREEKYLGTAGSLAFIKDRVSEPVLVCNADVLTRAPFHAILDFHRRESSQITSVVMPFHVKIPYGVVDIHGDRILSVQEKPEYIHHVNAGIYVLNPQIIRDIPVGEYLDMPDLVNKVLNKGGRVAPFLMHEYWIDIGRPEDYKKANDEFTAQFEEMTNG